ncbi:MAG: NERD domain-containing protein [Solirubrobacteraceae bacterium]
MSYPRRQEYRRLSRAGTALVGSAVAAVLALGIASIGALSLAGVLVFAALALGFSARHWLVLAGRSHVGARSEDQVRHALAPLRAEGWRVRHSLRWSRRGDIDSVAIAPGGFAFAIEVKTSRYDDRHLVMVREQAASLWRFRRRWCGQGVVPVLCVARARGVHRCEDGVLVVSIDRLAPTVRCIAT